MVSFFLFKPHIEGPKGAITTPDILVDRLFSVEDGNQIPAPVSDLTSELVQQVRPGWTVAPFFMLTALGGGTIISPGALLENGRLVAARKAWRFDNVASHADRLALNAAPLASIADPHTLLAQGGGEGTRLRRGIAIVAAGEPVTAADSFTVTLTDPVLSRELAHTVSLVDVTKEAWPDRPMPRYSTGPTKVEVQHYI